MAANSDGIDTHLDDRVVVATWLSHVAKVENVGFFDFELFQKMSHTEDFIHTWSNGINGSGAGDFVFELRTKLFAPCGDLIAFFAIWVPGIFGFSASFLAEGRKGNLREAVFDNFVTRGEFVFFPIAKLFGGLLDSGSNLSDLLISEGVVIDLFPIFFLGVIAVILSTLSNKKMQVAKLLWGRVW